MAVGKKIKEAEQPKEQVLVRKERVELKKKEGFRIVGNGKDKYGKILGVRTHADDLVLMEK